MLEQIAYEVPRTLERKQLVYQIGDLESLSATALYYGDGSSSGSSSGSGGGFGGFGIVESAYEKGKKKGPSSGGPKPSISIGALKVGLSLPGGLTIKDLTKNSVVLQEDFGRVGNIYTAHPKGSGSTRFYGNEFVNGIKQGKKRETKTIWEKIRDGEPL